MGDWDKMPDHLATWLDLVGGRAFFMTHSLRWACLIPIPGTNRDFLLEVDDDISEKNFRRMLGQVLDTTEFRGEAA